MKQKQKNNLISYRAPDGLLADIEARCNAGGDSRSLVAQRDLGRYYALLERALRELRSDAGGFDPFTAEELALICDACNGITFEPLAFGSLLLGVSDAIKLDGLDAQWGVDREILLDKLAALDALEESALLDAVERFWSNPERGEPKNILMPREESQGSEKMYFYLISDEWVGPADANRPEHWINLTHWTIRSEPGITNMSREPRIEGWLGTTNDRSYSAWGRYETVESARARIHRFARENGDTRVERADDESGDPSVIEEWTTARFETACGIYEWDPNRVGRDEAAADLTDEQIAEMAETWKSDAESQGVRIIDDVEEYLTECREQNREEAAGR